MNAASRDVVGTHCHLAKRGWTQRSCENIVRGFGVVFFPASRHSIQMKLLLVTFIVSFFIVLPISKHCIDEHQSMTLPLHKLICKVVKKTILCITLLLVPECTHTIYSFTITLSGYELGPNSNKDHLSTN